LNISAKHRQNRST